MEIAKENIFKSLPKFFLSRKLVLEFCKLQNLTMYELFEGLVEEGLGYRDFKNFVSLKGLAGTSKCILHGSNRVINKFVPQVSDSDPHPKNKNIPLIYATDNPDYAIFLATINANRKKGIASVSIQINALTNKAKAVCFIDQSYLDCGAGYVKGFVYFLPAKFFVEDSRCHFTSPNEITPLFAIPVEITDLKSQVIVE